VNTIGATEKSVEVSEATQFFESQNTFLSFLRITSKGSFLHKKHLFQKCSSLNSASNDSKLNTIGATGESVEVFEAK